MKTLRFCILLLALSGSAGSVWAAEPAAYQPIVLTKIAAVVNGEIITLQDLRRHSASEFMRLRVDPTDPAKRNEITSIMSKVLSAMIDDMLLRQEAERLKIKVPDQEVDNEVRMIIKRNHTTMKEFEAQLGAQGSSLDMVKERIRHSILSQRIISIMIARKAVVTDDEISAYFEEHKHEFTAEKKVDVSLIVFSPAANPKSILQQIQSGSLTFEKAAMQYSEGPAAEHGGNLGLIKWDDLAPPLKAQAMGLSPGKVGDIFQIEARNCLLKLNSATSGRAMNLDEARPEIERILREPRLQQRFSEYTQQLRSRSVVDIRL